MALAGVVAVVPLGAYLALRRGAADPTALPPLAAAGAACALVALYLLWAAPAITFPADILMWAESDFVNDLLKWRLGRPLYGPPADNSSINYPPAAPLLSGLLAQLVGQPDSLAVLRTLQLGYALLAALVAASCCRCLRRLAGDEPTASGWSACVPAALFLVAANPLTNPFVHNLQADSLALLMWIIGYRLLLGYVAMRSTWLLLPMALLPGLGFYVKQNLAVWAGLYALHLAVFDRPRSWVRLTGCSAGAAASLTLAALGGRWLWGVEFNYWIFGVLSHTPIMPCKVSSTLWKRGPIIWRDCWVGRRCCAAERSAGCWGRGCSGCWGCWGRPTPAAAAGRSTTWAPAA